mgnify:CR=1 FL=1
MIMNNLVFVRWWSYEKKGSSVLKNCYWLGPFRNAISSKRVFTDSEWLIQHGIIHIYCVLEIQYVCLARKHKHLLVLSPRILTTTYFNFAALIIAGFQQPLFC